MNIKYEKNFANKAFIEIIINQQAGNGVDAINKSLENLGAKVELKEGVYVVK